MYRKRRGAFKEYTITLMIEQSVLSVCYRSILLTPRPHCWLPFLDGALSP